ncbi:MAG: response regulator [Fibrobacteria bacterium]|nr:response regulator [Fibrobacteria bacterium]
MSNELGKTVLIVDDEDDVVRYLSMVLQDAGFTVVTAFDGIEAIERLKEKTPDLISLDIVMPKGSGIKMHRELKKHPEWSKIPVMIVTGHARDELGKTDFDEMTMSGPGIYLEKPVNAINYVAAVKKILCLEDGDCGGEKDLKSEVKQLLDTADADMLEKIKKMMRGEE